MIHQLIKSDKYFTTDRTFYAFCGISTNAAMQNREIPHDSP